MRELSQHLLDLGRNSLEAGATRLELTVAEDPVSDRLTLTVADNGRGMDEATLQQAADAFYTTRTTRRQGLGLALFGATCERCAGAMRLASRPGEGTVVSAELALAHVDRPPLGDVGAVLASLLCEAPDLALVYRHTVGAAAFTLDSGELRRELQEVPLGSPEVLTWLRRHVNEELKSLGSTA